LDDESGFLGWTCCRDEFFLQRATVARIVGDLLPIN
jgi:hypothetical protein